MMEPTNTNNEGLFSSLYNVFVEKAQEAANQMDPLELVHLNIPLIKEFGFDRETSNVSNALATGKKRSILTYLTNDPYYFMLLKSNVLSSIRHVHSSVVVAEVIDASFIVKQQRTRESILFFNEAISKWRALASSDCKNILKVSPYLNPLIIAGNGREEQQGRDLGYDQSLQWDI